MEFLALHAEQREEPTKGARGKRVNQGEAQQRGKKKRRQGGQALPVQYMDCLCSNSFQPKVLPRVLTVGSVCSGMLTDGFGLVEEYSPHELVMEWWCEKDNQARRFIDYNFPALENYSDALAPEFYQGAPYVDIMTGGFPCQPFSSQGKQLGEEYCRSQVVAGIIAYVRKTCHGLLCWRM